MPENKSNWLGYGFAVLATLIVGIGGYAWISDNDYSADDIAQAKTDATALALANLESAKTTSYNTGFTAGVTSVPPSDSTELDEIKALISEDDDWESEALDLATAEWTDHTYRSIFDAINDLSGCPDVVDREDIQKVTVRDDNVRHADADDKDANVYQIGRVIYNDGDDKCYLGITTEIRDGEVDEQTIITDDNKIDLHDLY